jgi:hypothetical protein
MTLTRQIVYDGGARCAHGVNLVTALRKLEYGADGLDKLHADLVLWSKAVMAKCEVALPAFDDH